MVRRVYGEGNDHYVSLKLSKDLHTKLVELSAELGVTKSEVVRRAVVKYRPTQTEREAATRE